MECLLEVLQMNNNDESTDPPNHANPLSPMHLKHADRDYRKSNKISNHPNTGGIFARITPDFSRAQNTFLSHSSVTEMSVMMHAAKEGKQTG